MDYRSRINKYDMMIIGKYFEKETDYVNVMRVCKKYHDLVQMYHFNPISDTSLFKNMETQHFYKKEDIKNKKEGMYQYIYWYEVDYKHRMSSLNSIYKRISLNSINQEMNENEDDVNENLRLIPIDNGIITIPEGIQLIKHDCFKDCQTLTNIQLPSSLIDIEHGAFYNTNIKEVTIPDGVTKYECKEPLFMKKILEPKNVGCPNCALDKEDVRRKDPVIKRGKCDIPEGITSVGSGCFFQ